MASVNATRSGLEQNVTNATEGAKLIGFNDHGEACVWFGGYTFNVYDAVCEWRETRIFTCGELAGVTDYDSPEAYEHAKDRMKSGGFDPIL